MDDHIFSYIIKMKWKVKVPRRGLSSPCLDNQKRKNTFIFLLQKPKMKNKRNKKRDFPLLPKTKKRRIVIDNNPPLPSLHWDFDEQTTLLLGTIIKKCHFFGTYSKHSKWVFNFKFNTHKGNIAIGWFTQHVKGTNVGVGSTPPPLLPYFQNGFKNVFKFGFLVVKFWKKIELLWNVATFNIWFLHKINLVM